MNTLNAVLSGAIAMAALVVAMFFLRFWRNTRDRFFLYFSVAFLLEGSSRALLGLAAPGDEDLPAFYLLRLLAYGLIIVAIVAKNRE